MQEHLNYMKKAANLENIIENGNGIDKDIEKANY